MAGNRDKWAEAFAFLDPTGEIRAELFPGRGTSRAPVALVADETVSKRARAYLASMPISVEGQHGSDRLYAAAAALVTVSWLSIVK